MNYIIIYFIGMCLFISFIKFTNIIKYLKQKHYTLDSLICGTIMYPLTSLILVLVAVYKITPTYSQITHFIKNQKAIKPVIHQYNQEDYLETEFLKLERTK